jgi:putative nucleotidyltransferase with HDIG domain
MDLLFQVVIMEGWRPGTITIEIFTNFLYPGMILKGDGYDEDSNKIINKDEPLTKELIQSIKQKGIKKISYSRKQLNLRKQVSQSAISEAKIEKAISIIDDIKGAIKQEGASVKLPANDIQTVVRDFISDIQSNNNAFLNLLDLVELDDYTYTHSINVSTLSVMIGMSLNLEIERVVKLGTAGLLHDIGKMLIPEEILQKPGKLTPEEWTIMKNHPVLGYNIVRADKSFGDTVGQGVLWHHENYSGGGYPFGITHEKLDQFSQIITIADVFDALTSNSPYKQSWPFADTFSFLMQNSGTKFQPGATQVFLNNMVKKINEEPLYPENAFVFLNTGEVAYVVGYRANPFTLRPIVNIFLVPQIINDKKNNKLLKIHQQVDLEKDYNRFIMKRIMDQQALDKLNSMIGKKG